MTHPLAWPGNKSDAYGMKAGDRVCHVYHDICGVVDEFMPDGDAFVTWDGNIHAIVKWGELMKESEA